MRTLIVTFVALALFPCSGMGAASSDQTAAALAQVFSDRVTDATFVLADKDGTVLQVHNAERAATRFSPASTFKIPNSLIALNEGVVHSADSEFRWDGKDKGRDAWNKDQTLRTAYRESCVWCYQQIARELGADTYRQALKKLDYGNHEIGTAVDQFWLNGVLKISADEQIAFLHRLLAGGFDFRDEHLATVRDIMIDQQEVAYTIRAKSGWTGPELHIGWYVGYVETSDEMYLFAMNMDLYDVQHAALRKELTLAALASLGII